MFSIPIDNFHPESRMQKILIICLVSTLLSVCATAQTSKRLIGTWVSYDRKDTMTVCFTNDTTVYFKVGSTPEFDDSAFKYWTYRIDEQYMLLTTPPHSDDLKYYLWFIDSNEIKLQGVRPEDSDNPTAHIPPATRENTLRLKRKGASIPSTEENYQIQIPPWGDKYSLMVAQLESGDTNIDYASFRNSFLDSKQFNVKTKKSATYDSLKKAMIAHANKSEFQEVMRAAKAMLSIDYTSLYAQKYLQQTYKILGDSVNRKKYHDIEFGLIYSITGSGDSKTCETSWKVIQIEEEYFSLSVIGATLKMQSLVHSKNGICDKMDVTMEDGTADTYYFGVNTVFAKYPK
jgi:hypothetical protein